MTWKDIVWLGLGLQLVAEFVRNRRLSRTIEQQQATIAGMQHEIHRRDQLLCWCADVLMRSGKTPEEMLRGPEGR